MTDFSAQYNTQLTPQQEAQYLAWRNQLSQQRGHDMALDENDYDLRGFWQSGAGVASNGHMTDQFKKPNHPTFSTGSIYNTPETPAGEWKKTGDKWQFTVSPYMLTMRSPQDIQQYFAQREPGNDVVFQNTAQRPAGLGQTPIPAGLGNVFAPIAAGLGRAL